MLGYATFYLEFYFSRVLVGFGKQDSLRGCWSFPLRFHWKVNKKKLRTSIYGYCIDHHIWLCVPKYLVQSICHISPNYYSSILLLLYPQQEYIIYIYLIYPLIFFSINKPKHHLSFEHFFLFSRIIISFHIPFMKNEK